MDVNISLLAAFGAGLLSFISPCVLPLIPGYLSFISGVSLEDMRGAATTTAARRRVIVASCAFVLGFSLVFVALGASASAIGQFVSVRLALLGRLAGIVVILFGLHTMGVLKLGWLYQEKRVHAQRAPTTLLGALLVGVAFAFGWTPCLGPILTGILALAGRSDSVDEGVRLLGAYSAGLAVPFIAAACAVDYFFGALGKIRRYYRVIEIVSGALLIAIGVLIFTNKLAIINQWLSPYLPAI